MNTKQEQSPHFPRSIGIWVELPDAALADSHGEGLVRWLRAFLRGVDTINDVEQIVIPCTKSAEPLIRRLFSDDTSGGQATALISCKLVFRAFTPTDSILPRLHAWIDGKRKRASNRLEILEVSKKPKRWLATLRSPPAEGAPRKKPFLLGAHRLGKIFGALLSLGFTGFLQLLLPPSDSPFESLAKSVRRAFPGITWVIPNPGWAAAAHLTGPKILTVADVVYREFPLFGVTAAEINEHARRLSDLAAAAEKVVCFSDHVARNHIAPALPGVTGKIIVVPHAPFQTELPQMPATESRQQLGRSLRGRFRAPPLNRHYCDFPFEDVEYLLVSSKCRPYKNYAGVIQAYEHVLRRFRRNLKLIVTGHLSGQPELVAELRRKGLVFDVIEATNVPDHVHSLLLANAQMLVIPTLFEGGMPFGFCEAIGMGTPCVMSRIPVVEETLTQEELATCEYFDPTDVSAMTRAILHVLDNREQVLARQSVIRERLLCRTWSDVAREYLALNEGDRVGPAG